MARRALVVDLGWRGRMVPVMAVALRLLPRSVREGASRRIGAWIAQHARIRGS